MQARISAPFTVVGRGEVTSGIIPGALITLGGADINVETDYVKILSRYYTYHSFQWVLESSGLRLYCAGDNISNSPMPSKFQWELRRLPKQSLAGPILRGRAGPISSVAGGERKTITLSGSVKGVNKAAINWCYVGSHLWAIYGTYLTDHIIVHPMSSLSSFQFDMMGLGPLSNVYLCYEVFPLKR